MLEVQAQNLGGVYERDDDKDIRLHISDDSFLFINESKNNSTSPLNCPDTIASGSWEMDDSGLFIKMYTHNEINFIKTIVQEEIDEDDDSIRLYISNPIEDNYARDNKRSRNGNKNGYLYYDISVDYTNYGSESHTYDTGSIALKPPDGECLVAIYMVICPKTLSVGWQNDMLPYCIKTISYEVEDVKSNIFRIDIPELTACYMSTRRFNGEYAKIVRRRVLEWDGHRYKKVAKKSYLLED